MKSLKAFLVGLSALVALSACAAEGLVTLTVHSSATNYVTNEVQIAVNQQATVKTYLESGVQPTNGQQGNSRLHIVKDGKTIEVWSSHFY